jgi:Rod binding domain-containing protein
MSYENLSLTGPVNLRKVKPLAENRQYVPKPYIDGAKNMEKQFAEHMIREMQKNSGKASSSTAETYYKSLLGSEYATQLTENNGGLGVQEVILDQLYPRKMRNKIAFAHYQKMQEAHLQNKNKPTMSNGNESNQAGAIQMEKPHEQH